ALPALGDVHVGHDLRLDVPVDAGLPGDVGLVQVGAGEAQDRLEQRRGPGGAAAAGTGVDALAAAVQVRVHRADEPVDRRARCRGAVGLLQVSGRAQRLEQVGDLLGDERSGAVATIEAAAPALVVLVGVADAGREVQGRRDRIVAAGEDRPGVPDLV